MPPHVCINFELDDIRAFVSHKKSLNFSSVNPHEEHYDERSQGAFENPVQNEKLHNIIEEIRQIINEKA